jgi:RNA polymerase subunit RPABC4/transcription elongation factor Spt4
MSKKLAHKLTKELIPEDVIRERGLRKSDFTPTWQGRLSVIDAQNSIIAKKVGIKVNGEYAIKVR